jgi:hypothetical protein
LVPATVAGVPVKESGFGANPNKLSPRGAGAPAGGDPALLLEPEAAAADGGGGVFNCATGMPRFFFFLGTFTTVDFAFSNISFGDSFRSSWSSSSPSGLLGVRERVERLDRGDMMFSACEILHQYVLLAGSVIRNKIMTSSGQYKGSSLGWWYRSFLL